jgi:trehalose 6-phosphate phosphatase
MTEMTYLFCHSGLAALDEALRARPLLAFDFDDTLAPTVEHPDEAYVPAALAQRLERLARLKAVAIITGRTVGDVSPRLGFAPRFIVGNHGAGVPGQVPTFDPAPLDALRARIRDHAEELRATRIQVEDKRYSLALDYGRTRDQRKALASIEALYLGHELALRFVGEKFEVNAVLKAAPDKADAIASLVERAGCDTALFAGDDSNDEAVFERAAPNSVRIHVGHDDAVSRAAFYVQNHAKVALLLDRLLRVLEPMQGAQRQVVE